MLSSRFPHISQLEMLVAIHDRGSISAAASLLGVTQQAVSSRMKSLEQHVGAALLKRTPRGSSLTADGVLVAGWAADVLAAAERLDAGIASLRSDHARELRVAASQTVAEHLLPLWLVSLRKQQESLGQEPATVSMSVNNSAATIDLVRAGKVTIGFIETPAVPHDVRSSTVLTDRLVVVVPPTHAWARRRSLLTAQELALTPLVTREQGSGTRYALEHILQAHNLPVPVEPALEFSTTAAVRSAIASGTAPGVLSELAVRDDLALGRLSAVPVAGPELVRPITAIWNGSDLPPAGAARDLLAVALKAQH